MKLLGIAGSLRAASYNKGLLRAASELLPDGVTLDVFTRLGEIPLFDEDAERGGDPEAVVALKQAIAASDALLIATPEYNAGVPGVLKNALDWASRPPGRAALRRKPVALLGASPGMLGTSRAQASLRQSLQFTESFVMLRPEIFVARAGEKFDAEGRLTDEPTRKIIRQMLEALGPWVSALSSLP